MEENLNHGVDEMNDSMDRMNDGAQLDSGNRDEQNSVVTDQNENPRSTRGRGLASADPATRQRVASQGGRAAHAKGTAHEWNSDEAREAGRKGGKIVSQDRQHMSEIGRKGGLR